jgi:hypothetical protein
MNCIASPPQLGVPFLILSWVYFWFLVCCLHGSQLGFCTALETQSIVELDWSTSLLWSPILSNRALVLSTAVDYHVFSSFRAMLLFVVCGFLLLILICDITRHLKVFEMISTISVISVCFCAHVHMCVGD